MVFPKAAFWDQRFLLLPEVENVMGMINADGTTLHCIVSSLGNREQLRSETGNLGTQKEMPIQVQIWQTNTQRCNQVASPKWALESGCHEEPGNAVEMQNISHDWQEVRG